MEEPLIPDSPTPIVGYRVWGVDETRLLHSTSSGFMSDRPVWQPFEPFAAACLALTPCRGQTPSLQHGCGIHAYGSLEPALKWAKAMPWERAVVVGTVKLWGRVVETQRGWRAEKAYPESFITVVTRVRRRALDGVCLQELGETYATARPFEGIAR